ncbi:MAG: glycosyltransferase family A protein [Bacteriovoracaceae bacterium]|nr:glycosyltransferase family A protein [Bacteriovoracaceae bacterium]
MPERKKPECLVVVSCYNEGEFLLDALDSLSKQTFHNYITVIVDDGSNDLLTLEKLQTLEMNQELRSKYKIKEIIRKKNEGPSIAYNAALSSHVSDYAMVLNGDDALNEEYLSSCIEFLETNPDFDVCYTDGIFFGKQKGAWRLTTPTLPEFLFNNCVHASAIYRYHFFLLSEGYSPDLLNGHEDWDYWLKFFRKGAKFKKLDHLYFYYRKRNHSRSEKFGHDPYKVFDTYQKITQKHNELFLSPIYVEEIQKRYFLLQQKKNKIKKLKSQFINWFKLKIKTRD